MGFDSQEGTQAPVLSAAACPQASPFPSLSFDFSFCDLKSGEEGTELYR